MNFDEYQKETLRTGAELRTFKDWLLNAAIGMCGESGEVADLIKKYVYQSHGLDRDALKKELGDVLWYVAWMAEALSIPLSDVADANVAKLRERYPDGFDEARSRDRGEGMLTPAQALQDVIGNALADIDVEEEMRLHRGPGYSHGCNDNDCNDVENPTPAGGEPPDGGRCDSVCKATTNNHAALFEAHPLPWKVYVYDDPPTAREVVFIDDANDKAINEASSAMEDDWLSFAFARFVVDAANKYADSTCAKGPRTVAVKQGPPPEPVPIDVEALKDAVFLSGLDLDKDPQPNQPVEPHKPPTVTIPSERLELEERMREHMKGAGRVVVKGGTD